ncbi:HMG box domain-containing protein [Aphelenchoides besseyi]|nr:HMG box domain-containing protein [Aphelenchoides besseyi]KAI6225842.1 HMG box domain-containing protein [Aphelenchoides besseyi]
MSKNFKNTKTVSRRAKKDTNAPKYPLNAYAIFYRHFHTEYNRKNPDRKLGGQGFTILASQGWRSLTEDEKKPFQELAQKERERYAKEMEVYKKSAGYKEFMTNNQPAGSSTRFGEVEVFSKEFLAHNKARETELRNLRRKITTTEEEIGTHNDKIEELKKQLDSAYSLLPTNKKTTFEKERQYMIWSRELVCQLDKSELLAELNLSYNSTPEEVVETLENAVDDADLAPKVQSALKGLLLEIF